METELIGLSNPGKKTIAHIVNMVQKSLHVVPSSVVASEFDEFAAGPSCRSTTIRETRVCLLSICESGIEELA